jgi:SAM-dependent methyltransferase
MLPAASNGATAATANARAPTRDRPVNNARIDPREIAHLIDRWEAMSERYLPGRSRLVDGLLAELRTFGADPSVLDLGCGPASLLTTVAEDLPGASLIGVDNDPVLLELAHATLARFDERCTIIDAAIEPGWSEHVCADGPFDTVVTMLVLHYFPAEAWPHLLREIRSVLRPGGLLAVIDVVADPTIETRVVPDDHPGPTWGQWWDLAASIGEPVWQGAFAERAVRATSPSAEHHPSLAELTQLLERAGFTDVRAAHRSGPAYLATARTPVV